ncbi:MAG: hypothetical protein KDK75_01230, partial [Alphaproteobacteria bacterium]|nr:hypothetical protein [Alphaproteobacteria bacterium]
RFAIALAYGSEVDIAHGNRSAQRSIMAETVLCRAVAVNAETPLISCSSEILDICLQLRISLTS